MIEAAPLARGEPTLAGFLRARARAASEGRLGLDIAVGLVATIVAAALRPDWWTTLAASGVCLSAFGFWAVADRIETARKIPERAAAVFRVARIALAVIGLAAALVLGFTLWARSIGTWIS